MTAQHPDPTTGEREAREVLAEHPWHITIWGDLPGYGWRCSCGILDWGTEAENPARYVHHPTREAACLAAVEHITEALNFARREREAAERAWDGGARRVWESLADHAWTLEFYTDDNPYRAALASGRGAAGEEAGT